MTDLPDVVPQLEKTIDLNRTAWCERGKISAVALPWGNIKPADLEFIHSQVDIILLSDCVYYEEVCILMHIHLRISLLLTVSYLY